MHHRHGVVAAKEELRAALEKNRQAVARHAYRHRLNGSVHKLSEARSERPKVALLSAALGDVQGFQAKVQLPTRHTAFLSWSICMHLLFLQIGGRRDGFKCLGRNMANACGGAPVGLEGRGWSPVTATNSTACHRFL